ncbi:conjugative transfer signal peptidase TraF [Enterobacter ludwigii]
MKTLALRLLSGTVLLLLILCGICYHYGYRINTSISYPTGLYQLVKGPKTYHRGELVLFCPPNNTVMQEALYRDYIKPGLCSGNFEPVIKKVMAEEGDTVTFEGIVRINGIPVPGARMHSADSLGRALPAQSTVTLAHSQFFLMSDHLPDVSFDSRYYGPVSASKIIDHIRPVFTR